MPLQPPPETLDGFPLRRSSTAVRTLYRIFWERDRSTGQRASPWRFAAAPPGAGRFDLPSPRGTCYWSDRRYGAWLEVFRGARLVDVADARRRRLATGRAPALRLADLLAPRAYAFGVTAANSSTPDHGLPQQWAAAADRAGMQGVVGSCSHDPTSRALNVAVFGRAGQPATQPGWRIDRGRLETDEALLSELVAFGVRVAAVPYDVPTVPAP